MRIDRFGGGTLKSASPTVIPNVFLQNVCAGSRWGTDPAWVKKLPELNGFSPREVWNHPELLLSKADQKINPSMGPLTLVATRVRIINIVRPHVQAGARLTPADVHLIGNLPVATTVPDLVSVRDEDPAPLPVYHRKRPGSNGIARESMLLANRRRQRNRHHGRTRHRAFRPR